MSATGFTVEARCESCERRRPTMTVRFGPVEDGTRFEVCGLCAVVADSHGFVLLAVEDEE